MVVEKTNVQNASLPPSQWMLCKCGHRELKSLGKYEPDETFEER